MPARMTRGRDARRGFRTTDHRRGHSSNDCGSPDLAATAPAGRHHMIFSFGEAWTRSLLCEPRVTRRRRATARYLVRS